MNTSYLQIKILLILLFPVVAGCITTAPLYLQNHFPMDPKSSEVLQAKLPPLRSERMPMGMAIVQPSESHDLKGESAETWPQLAAKVKNNVEATAPVFMDKVIFVKDLGSPDSLTVIKNFGRESQIDTIMVVLASESKVSVPARFDLLPEVSLLNGRQTDHHATVELGLVDANSGKLLLQVQGHSFATLDELDTPVNSNRYPRVRGSAMSTYIYPQEEQAMEMLRAVALGEALEQAVMKLQERWPKA